MKKQNRKWVICFSGYWDNTSIYGIGNIILKFNSDGYKILWINSIPNRNPSVKRAGSKIVLAKNILKKIKHHLKLIRKNSEDFYVYTPIYLPFVENTGIYKLNLKILKLQIEFLKWFLNIKEYIVFASSTIEIPYIFNSKKYIKYFHYVADLYSEYREASIDLKRKIRVRENKIFNSADFVLVSSSRVIQKIEKIIENKSKIIYFPHGVDYNHFNLVKSKIRFNYKRPIVGYFGSLSMANDQDVFIALANAGYSVVLIGRKAGDYAQCERNENIHFLGAISYQQLPSYSNEFDIAIMAWKPSLWIENSNPKKTYEYLAQGKPVVCNTIPEIKHQLEGVVYFADTPDEFVKQCAKALSENSQKLVSRRKEIAQNVDWSTKYNLIQELINA